MHKIIINNNIFIEKCAEKITSLPQYLHLVNGLTYSVFVLQLNNPSESIVIFFSRAFKK
jgi:hypothetical protein